MLNVKMEEEPQQGSDATSATTATTITTTSSSTEEEKDLIAVEGTELADGMQDEVALEVPMAEGEFGAVPPEGEGGLEMGDDEMHNAEEEIFLGGEENDGEYPDAASYYAMAVGEGGIENGSSSSIDEVPLPLEEKDMKEGEEGEEKKGAEQVDGKLQDDDTKGTKDTVEEEEKKKREKEEEEAKIEPITAPAPAIEELSEEARDAVLKEMMDEFETSYSLSVSGLEGVDNVETVRGIRVLFDIF